MSQEIKSPKKLIEVALPLDFINEEAVREKSIRHGHPSTLHLWWARRPLAAARAVLFAQMVNAPRGKGAAKRREELFDIIKELVKWENVNNESVLKRAREAILKSWRETCELNRGKPGFDPDRLPAFHDPFAGGGAIPLEAQRLGLESYASDLNPVAVMINKAMIEIPPKFADSQPVGPFPAGETKTYPLFEGTLGLAEDVRRYGYWMREEAKKRIGYLYPEVTVPKESRSGEAGKTLTVIAWLWARTVKSPNPAFSHVDVPLISSFVLSKKKGHEAYVEPVIEGDSYHFEVRYGKSPKGAENGTKAGKRGGFYCILSNSPIDYDYIRESGLNNKANCRLMAIVAEGKNGRIYLSPTREHSEVNLNAVPEWSPHTETEGKCKVNIGLYGLDYWDQLFTNRQLVALNTFSGLVEEARQKVLADAVNAGMPDDGRSLDSGGTQATAYADAVAVDLAFVVDKVSDYWSSICTWHNSGEKIGHTFGRQAIPMTWDYVEANPFCTSSGNWTAMVDWVYRAIKTVPGKIQGTAQQQDAQTQTISRNKIVSTDPPYYDNIGYADLSDYFYVWMRKTLRPIFPDLFATIATPKAEELVATPFRHGGRENADRFFLDGMTEVLRNLAKSVHPAFPVTIYYAFKASVTGWATFLSAVLKAGFSITGTWPMRTELGTRMVGMGANALASSIVLVCRKRDQDAETISRNEFVNKLREVMPTAIKNMIGQDGITTPIAPVDLAQAAIGPGMEIFSRYSAVLKVDGSEMPVEEAIIEINKEVDKTLDPEGGGFDPETLFCNFWFREYGWKEKDSWKAQELARSKGASIDLVKDAGMMIASGGIARLVHWKEYPLDYDPAADKNRPTWAACHHLMRAFYSGGVQAARHCLSQMPEAEPSIKQLAYYLYTICSSSKNVNTEEAGYYNDLMKSWEEITEPLSSSANQTPNIF